MLTNLTEIRTLQEQIKERERLAYLGQLSATIAHEIRNPLNSVDFSGSYVTVSGCRFENIGDKGTSVGENSHPILINNLYYGCNIGFSRESNHCTGQQSGRVRIGDSHSY